MEDITTQDIIRAVMRSVAAGLKAAAVARIDEGKAAAEGAMKEALVDFAPAIDTAVKAGWREMGVGDFPSHLYAALQVINEALAAYWKEAGVDGPLLPFNIIEALEGCARDADDFTGTC